MGAGESSDDFAAMDNSQWYQKFMNQCPSGQLSLYEFKTILGLRDMSPQANMYVERVFHIFDLNQVGLDESLKTFMFPPFTTGRLCDGPAPEMHHYYSKFMRECPSGQLSLHEFKKLLDLQGLDPQGDMYIKRVFDIFDLNQDGFIDFLEFIAAINLVIRGKIDQKLKWYFKLYDADGNGCIDKKELLNIFTAIQAINGYTSTTPEEFTDMVFQKVDVNNDGQLTLEEFITGVEKDEGLMELITKTFDLSNVLKVIQSGRRHSI